MSSLVAEDAKAAARELSRELRGQIRELGASAFQVSQQMGRAPQYLTRVFNAKMELKMKDAFGVFVVLGRHPRPFFERIYPLPTHSGQGPDGFTFVAEMLARRGKPSAIPSAEQLVERSRSILKGMIARSGVHQRTLSRALGLTNDSLGQALRQGTDLMAWHVLGILDILGKPPGAFFTQLFQREESDPAHQELATLLERTLDLFEGDAAKADAAASLARLRKRARTKGRAAKGPS